MKNGLYIVIDSQVRYADNEAYWRAYLCIGGRTCVLAGVFPRAVEGFLRRVGFLSDTKPRPTFSPR